MILVGVCGGRDYTDVATLHRVLSREVPIGGVIVHGGQRNTNGTGADWLAEGWAELNRIDIILVRALWKQFGNAAGPRRNGVMASLPLAKLVAFPGGRGTADMVRRCRVRGIPVIEVPQPTTRAA